MRAGPLRRIATTALSMAVLMIGLVVPASAAPPVGTVRLAPAGQGIEHSYLVVLKQDKVMRSATDATARTLAARQGGRVGYVYRGALQGFEVSLDEAAAQRLAADPAVAYVEQNSVVRLQDSQFDPPLGLDLLDQRGAPLDNWYTYPTTAPNVRVYVIDSGIQATHVDFEFRVTDGPSFGTTQPANTDCMGHGTHVAGIIGSATYGVAKGVTLTPVRVFDCADTTSTGNVLAGMEWVYLNHQSNPGELAVVNMSITGGAHSFIDQYVWASVNQGMVYTVAAGNDRINACALSPAREPAAVTVGGTYPYGYFHSQFTNFGPCVDVYAPANGILSTWHTTDFAEESLDGTSMASAHAAGVAAIFRSLHPSLSAAQIHELIRQTAVQGLRDNQVDPPYSALHLPQVVIGPPLPKVDSMQGFGLTRQLTAAGGTGPYTWSATGLPGGMTINPATGLLTGFFGGAGTYTVTVTATDATGRSGSITEKWRIIRDPCPTC
jgi:subtilisin family serine protease